MIRERLPGEPEQWVLPGGLVEPGELAHDAVVREIQEETGLTVAGPTSLACISQHVVTGDPAWNGTWTVLTFRTERATGVLGPRDPDELVLEAAWVPLSEAQARLAAHPSPRRREPIIACLTGLEPPGTLWLWPSDSPELPVVIPAAAARAVVDEPCQEPAAPVSSR